MRTGIDHDVCSEMIFAADVRAGDYVAGLGEVEAVLEAPGPYDPYVLLCSGEYARKCNPLTRVEVFAGLCEDCGETLDDCDNYGCGADDGPYCEQCNDYH